MFYWNAKEANDLMCGPAPERGSADAQLHASVSASASVAATAAVALSSDERWSYKIGVNPVPIDDEHDNSSESALIS